MTTINLPKPWQFVDDRRRTYIGRELAWEASHFPDHPLAKRTFQVVAMMDSYDNAIIQFDDGAFGYVHLPWKAESPHFEPIGGEAEGNGESRTLLSRSAVSRVTEALWEEYEAFTKRDLVSFDVVYLFCDAVYESLRQQAGCRQAILVTWAICADGSKQLLHMSLHQKMIRTTNLCERSFVEERRRTKVIPRFFDEKGCLKLVFATLWRASQRWRGVRFTAMERQQLEAYLRIRRAAGVKVRELAA